MAILHRITRSTLALAMAVFLPCVSALGQNVGHGVGDFFPDVELPKLDGSGTVRLSSFRGQRLLLIEFASW
ncbi:MAG: hypothetical protein ACI8QZ_003123 [Chlamydiales bacterium]|jgi:hypothetical protein